MQFVSEVEIWCLLQSSSQTRVPIEPFSATVERGAWSGENTVVRPRQMELGFIAIQVRRDDLVGLLHNTAPHLTSPHLTSESASNALIHLLCLDGRTACALVSCLQSKLLATTGSRKLP